MVINIEEELNNPKNWKKTHKKQYDIYLREIKIRRM